MAIPSLAEFIKKNALELGFNQCGISPVMDSAADVEQLKTWIAQNYNAEMEWIERSIPLRSNPSLLLPEVKSVVMVTLNYFSENHPFASDYKVSKYALNQDYHAVLKSKLYQLLSLIMAKDETIEGKIFVDSGPIFEKAYAVNAGLGWIGKNSCLIQSKSGSFFFLGTLLLNVEMEYDQPYTQNNCGTCNRCIEACPTDALIAPYTLDSNRCIAYLTIEHRGEISSDIDFKKTNQIFGCDICQDVCPHNKFSLKTHVNELIPATELLAMTNSDWEEMTSSNFKKQFKNSPLLRAGYKKIKSNIAYLNSNNDEN
jgi:epoxyqueuosine reductase